MKEDHFSSEDLKETADQRSTMNQSFTEFHVPAKCLSWTSIITFNAICKFFCEGSFSKHQPKDWSDENVESHGHLT